MRMREQAVEPGRTAHQQIDLHDRGDDGPAHAHGHRDPPRPAELDRVETLPRRTQRQSTSGTPRAGTGPGCSRHCPAGCPPAQAPPAPRRQADEREGVARCANPDQRQRHCEGCGKDGSQGGLVWPTDQAAHGRPRSAPSAPRPELGLKGQHLRLPVLVDGGVARVEVSWPSLATTMPWRGDPRPGPFGPREPPCARPGYDGQRRCRVRARSYDEPAQRNCLSGALRGGGGAVGSARRRCGSTHAHQEAGCFSWTGPDQEESPWPDATSSSTPRASPCAAGSTPRTGRARRARPIVMAHGFSAVKEMYLDQLRRGVRRGRPQRAGVRQPQLRRQRRRAAPGDRPLGAGPRLPARHHLRAAPCPRSTRPDRRLGQQLLRRPRARRRRDRPAGQGRRQRRCRWSAGTTTCARWCGPTSSPGSASCSTPTALARFRGEPPAMVPVVDEDPLAPSALPTPDSWEWFTETGKTARAVLAERGDAAQRGDVHRVRAGSYLPYISPTPAADGRRAGDHLTPADLAIAAYEHGARAQASS